MADPTTTAGRNYTLTYTTWETEGLPVDPPFPKTRRQLSRVYLVMRDGYWRILPSIRMQILERFWGFADSECAISARLRDFRKPDCPTLWVDKRPYGKGKAHEYRLRLRTRDDR